MQKKLFYKSVIVFALIVVIGIALSMIAATIETRARFRDAAVQSIATESVRQQTLTGPILVVPYVEEYDEVPAGGKAGAQPVRRSVARRHLIYPDHLFIDGAIDTDRRYRGIHQVLVYSGRYGVKGDFVLPAKLDLPRAAANSTVTPGAPYVALAIADVRGIRNLPRLNWNGGTADFEQGAGLEGLRSGIRAPLTAADLAAGRVAFHFDLGLDGIEQMRFVPVAKNNQVKLKSPWPHPQFGGRFLPDARTREVGKDGFRAAWAISSLASGAQQQLRLIEDGAQETQLDSFGVGFIEPVNIYLQADRATKYGLLFVVLTFTGVFMFELLKRLRIHPVQYLLVGLALAIFFLLLVSLSEHVAFGLAYLVSSLACIALIAFYLAHVLGSRRRGLGVAAGLTLLYAVLYGLLQSENNALIMGAVLLFAVLSAVMLVTRKVDWYQLGNEAPA